jgi:hypothetical protein
MPFFCRTSPVGMATMASSHLHHPLGRLTARFLGALLVQTTAQSEERDVRRGWEIGPWLVYAAETVLEEDKGSELDEEHTGVGDERGEERLGVGVLCFGGGDLGHG